MDMTTPAMLARMSRVQHIILVLSGKGGVGKSTVTVQLAQALVSMGKRVGILDIDVCGPSIPKMMGLVGKEVIQTANGWTPVYADNENSLEVMSLGFLLSSDSDAVVWRGPKKDAIIRQFLEDVIWGDIDYLLIDTPPGTSDEHISIAQYLGGCNPDGAVVVTTPQSVSTDDVRKEVAFCNRVGFKIIGIVENMSGFVCPCCGEVTNVFASGGGEFLAMEVGSPFLGRIPLDGNVSLCEDRGINFLGMQQKSPAAISIMEIVKRVVDVTGPSQ